MSRSQPRARLHRALASLTIPLIMTSVLAGSSAAARAAACQNWTGTQPPSPGSRGNQLYAVAVVSACQAWAVGDDITSNGGTQTLTERWNGSSWTVLPSPDPGTPDNVLTSVHAVSAANVWAAGYYTDREGGSQTLVLHWNGTSWTQVASPSPGTINRLYGIRAVSAGDAWAVGFFSNGAGDRSLVLHWNGSHWTRVPSPDPGPAGSDNDLYSVTAAGRSDAWAVGEVATSSKITTLIAHWNGRRWTRMASPNPGRSNELFSVTATSASNAWAVGDATNGTANQTLILRWNGDRWTRVPSPDQGGSTNRNILAAATATGTRNAWAVGYIARGSGTSTLILHWNGTRWAHMASPSLGTSSILLGVAATSAANAWVVGAYDSSDSGQALALHCC